jgi:prepilin-type N-terminal cleavage/methylation domain-containing protein
MSLFRFDGSDIMKNQGFTLIELMMVITIICVIAAVAIPVFASHRDRANLRRIASDLKTFGDAFYLYVLDRECYPPDSHDDAPNHLKNGYDTENYVPVQAWLATPPWGGFYNWEGPDGYAYAGISLYDTSAPQSIMISLDKMMDDGDLNTGKFRQTANGRYTYIVDDNPVSACP